jgi:hypothetical protein
MISAMKKDPHMLDTDVATEASIFGQTTFQKTVNGTTVDAVRNRTFGEGAKMVADAVGRIPKAVAIPVAIVAAIIALLIIIRNLVYLFYSGSIKLKDYTSTQKEFVELAIQQEKEDGESDVVIKKHRKLADRLASIANFIEVKILHSNQKAKDELAKSNKENYSSTDFKPSFGGNIEF